MRESPVVRGGRVEIGKRTKMALSCDRKIVDGAVGVALVAEVKALLEKPAQLLTAT
jgi:pyruvate/2-oxoglutarate dehydrogenase complex dihydrolipoamide acyltransferase (E2) component